MRIRKNSRLINGAISTTNSAASSSSSPSSFLICQLNRSPWDVLDAFSLQGEWGASFKSLPASDSLYSGESMELSFEYVEKSTRLQEQEEEEERENGGIEDEFLPTLELEAMKTTPSSRPIHHPSPPPLPLQKAAATTIPKKRGRPKKPVAATPTTTAAATSNNPYEFYYYSGFGPSWAKRRGAERLVEVVSHVAHNKKKKIKARKEKEKDNGVLVVGEELDYIDDDQDEEEEELSGGRRARKPIKARSLKSLM